MSPKKMKSKRWRRYRVKGGDLVRVAPSGRKYVLNGENT